MSKGTSAGLPPIELEDKPEKIALPVPTQLRSDVEQFAKYFQELSGRAPASLNAVYIGILTKYLQDHSDFQRWKKTDSRITERARPAASAS